MRLVRGFFSLRDLFGVLFQHGGHAGLITAAGGFVCLDRASFDAE